MSYTTVIGNSFLLRVKTLQQILCIMCEMTLSFLLLVDVVRWDVSGAVISTECGTLESGSSVVFLRDGERRLCTPYMDTTGYGNLRFYFSMGEYRLVASLASVLQIGRGELFSCRLYCKQYFCQSVGQVWLLQLLFDPVGSPHSSTTRGLGQ